MHPIATMSGGERGGATSVEMALVWTAMLSLVLTGIQVALLYYADQVSLTAAQDGLRAGRYLEHPSADSARRDAQAFLDRTGGRVLLAPAVTAEMEAGRLRVEVTGTALSFIPGLQLPVRRVADGPIEVLSP